MNRLSFLPNTAFIISALLTAGAAHATTPVADCAVLDTPGERYVLTADVAFPGGGACFEIVADDVELDLGEHTVEGPGSADGSRQGALIDGNIGARNVIGASLDNAVDATVSNNNC